MSLANFTPHFGGGMVGGGWVQTTGPKPSSKFLKPRPPQSFTDCNEPATPQNFGPSFFLVRKWVSPL